MVHRLLCCWCALSAKAIRLHHPKLEQSAKAVHRGDVRRRGARAWAQCRTEPLDDSVETVGHRGDYRVYERANGRALREVLEVRCGSRVCQEPLYRIVVSARNSETLKALRS